MQLVSSTTDVNVANRLGIVASSAIPLRDAVAVMAHGVSVRQQIQSPAVAVVRAGCTLLTAPVAEME